MKLIESINNFVLHPYPLWEVDLTDKLVQSEWAYLQSKKQLTPNNYSTIACLQNYNIQNENKILLNNNSTDVGMHLEIPSHGLEDFYNEHGLLTLAENEIQNTGAVDKLLSALSIFKQIRPSYECIQKLVRAIQVLKQDDDETDLSYSHPKIPFSIFVSICRDSTAISNLRVAESILHEAMHLKLTLIENHVPLIKSASNNLYYSPWREEKRPVQGVLHGLFVFRAILNFLNELNLMTFQNDLSNYIVNRTKQINAELIQIGEFHTCSDLTEEGAILTKNLLS